MRFLTAVAVAVATGIAVVTAAGAPPPPGDASEVSVSAASSLTEAMQEFAAAWQKAGGERVVLNFGASSLLARQIEEGAPADLFLSADEAKMDDLDKKNLVVRETRRSLLSNTLVIVVAEKGSPAIASAEDLARPAVRVLALAEPGSVPAGIYAREYLVKKGLWDRVSARVVPTENVRAALAAVESGNADAAIVYRTDALVSKKVRVAYEVPLADGPRISYPVAVVKSARNPEGARRFLAFLASADGLAIFRRHGFLVP